MFIIILGLIIFGVILERGKASNRSVGDKASEAYINVTEAFLREKLQDQLKLIDNIVNATEKKSFERLKRLPIWQRLNATIYKDAFL